MRLFRPRFRLTDADPNVVGFFFTQYVELMKHGKDGTDLAMKKYLFECITALGVPEEIALEAADDDAPEATQYPIINRRNV